MPTVRTASTTTIVSKEEVKQFVSSKVPQLDLNKGETSFQFKPTSDGFEIVVTNVVSEESAEDKQKLPPIKEPAPK